MLNNRYKTKAKKNPLEKYYYNMTKLTKIVSREAILRKSIDTRK